MFGQIGLSKQCKPKIDCSLISSLIRACAICQSITTFYTIQWTHLNFKLLVNVLKFRTLFFLFSNELSFIRAGIRKVLFRIANREDLNRLLLQKLSDLGLRCLSRPFWQATSV